MLIAGMLHPANLLEALPNCVRIGFTGISIETNAKRTTRRIFGSFIDQYNIRQSQADGVTLPILYQGLEARGDSTSGDDLDQLFELQHEAQARGREEFIRWYCDRLRPILDTQIAALVNCVGASPRSVQVRQLGYRWGSCGHKGDLYFHAPCGDAAANDD